MCCNNKSTRRQQRQLLQLQLAQQQFHNQQALVPAQAQLHGFPCSCRRCCPNNRHNRCHERRRRGPITSLVMLIVNSVQESKQKKREAEKVEAERQAGIEEQMTRQQEGEVSNNEKWEERGLLVEDERVNPPTYNQAMRSV